MQIKLKTCNAIISAWLPRPRPLRLNLYRITNNILRHVRTAKSHGIHETFF